MLYSLFSLYFSMTGRILIWMQYMKKKMEMKLTFIPTEILMKDVFLNDYEIGDKNSNGM